MLFSQIKTSLLLDFCSTNIVTVHLIITQPDGKVKDVQDFDLMRYFRFSFTPDLSDALISKGNHFRLFKKQKNKMYFYTKNIKLNFMNP